MMNEQIFELAKQIWPDPAISHVNHTRFAELLIKECAATIQDFVDHRIPASEYSERLKRHYGI